MSASVVANPLNEANLSLESSIPNPPKEGSLNGRKIAVLALSGIATGIAIVALVVAAVFAWYVALAVCAAVVAVSLATTALATYDLKNKKKKEVQEVIKTDDAAIHKLQEEHQKVVAANEQRIKELEGQIEAANKKIAELTAELNEIEEVEEGDETSDSQVKELQAQIKKYRDNLDMAKGAYLAMQNDLEKSRGESFTLQGQIKTHKEIQEKLTREKDAAEKETKRVKRQLKEAVAEVEKLKQSISSSKNQQSSDTTLESLTAQLEQDNQRLQKLLDQKIKEFEEKQSVSSSENNQPSSNAILESEIARLTENKKALETKIQEINDHYTQEIAQLKKDLEEALIREAALKQEAQKPRPASVSLDSDALDKIIDFTDENQRVASLELQLKQERATITDQVSMITQLQGERDKWKNKSMTEPLYMQIALLEKLIQEEANKKKTNQSASEILKAHLDQLKGMQPK